MPLEFRLRVHDEVVAIKIGGQLNLGRSSLLHLTHPMSSKQLNNFLDTLCCMPKKTVQIEKAYEPWLGDDKGTSRNGSQDFLLTTAFYRNRHGMERRLVFPVLQAGLLVKS